MRDRGVAQGFALGVSVATVVVVVGGIFDHYTTSVPPSPSPPPPPPIKAELHNGFHKITQGDKVRIEIDGAWYNASGDRISAGACFLLLCDGDDVDCWNCLTVIRKQAQIKQKIDEALGRKETGQ